MSPMPWSRTISPGARESMQETTAAKGYWPDAVAITLALQSRGLRCPETNRALPSLRRASAVAGVIAACDSFVWTCASATAAAAAHASAAIRTIRDPRIVNLP